MSTEVFTTPEELLADDSALTPAQEYARDLRDLAEFFDANPDLPSPGETSILVSTVTCADPKALLARFARAFGKAAKVPEGPYFSVVRWFGQLKLDVYTQRENVCRRVVTGTREVPEQVLSAHTEDIVEWVCDEPLLAPTETAT